LKEADVIRQKESTELIEYMQKEHVIHIFVKILYSRAITYSEQILIKEFKDAWIKYKTSCEEGEEHEAL
jgi:hypothetical protein